MKNYTRPPIDRTPVPFLYLVGEHVAGGEIIGRHYDFDLPQWPVYLVRGTDGVETIDQRHIEIELVEAA